MAYSGKWELETLGKLLLMSAFLVVVVLVGKGLMDAAEENQGGFVDFACFASNLLKNNVMSAFPTSCSEQNVGALGLEDENELGVVADLIDRCWWMYGSGEWDLGVKYEPGEITKIGRNLINFDSFDYVYPCYAFSLKKELKMKDLYAYLQTHERGAGRDDDVEISATDPDTYWNHIQKASEGNGFCIDGEMGDVLKANKVYYIKFFDERHFTVLDGDLVRKDKILISGNKMFGEGTGAAISAETDIIDSLFKWWGDHCKDMDDFVKIDNCYEMEKKECEEADHCLLTKDNKCVLKR